MSHQQTCIINFDNGKLLFMLYLIINKEISCYYQDKIGAKK